MNIFVLLEYTWFKILCQFQVYSKVNQQDIFFHHFHKQYVPASAREYT